jgi:hypothetical protein
MADTLRRAATLLGMVDEPPNVQSTAFSPSLVSCTAILEAGCMTSRVNLCSDSWRNIHCLRVLCIRVLCLRNPLTPSIPDTKLPRRSLMFRWLCCPSVAEMLLKPPVAAQTLGEITGVTTDQSGGEVVGVSMTRQQSAD